MMEEKNYLHVAQPKRRRSILKRIISEAYPIPQEESTTRTLDLDDDDNGQNTVPTPDFTLQVKRRVSFGSSFIKEFHTASFEEDVAGKDGNITRFMNNDMELDAPNFDETYVVCGENKENNSPPHRPHHFQDVTFSVPKQKFKRLLTNRDTTFVSSVDMDISQSDDFLSRDNAEKNLLSTTTRILPVSSSQVYRHNSTVRLPSTMDLSLGANDSTCSTADSGFKSGSLSPSKTFYGGDMSVCRELLYDRRQLPLKENATLTWALPDLPEPVNSNSTFVVDCLPEEMHCLPNKTNTYPQKNDDNKSISSSSIVEECLDDQLEPPSLYQSMMTADNPSLLSVTHDEINDSSAEELIQNFNISQKLSTFIKQNDSIRGSERVKYMDEIMEEIINMPLEIYDEFC